MSVMSSFSVWNGCVRHQMLDVRRETLGVRRETRDVRR